MLKIYLSGLFTAFLMTFLSTNALAEANVERGMAKYKVCVACHGQNGAGKKSNNAPKLAGQMSWYLERQLYNFKNGIRATHIDDVEGDALIALQKDFGVLGQECCHAASSFQAANGREAVAGRDAQCVITRHSS